MVQRCKMGIDAEPFERLTPHNSTAPNLIKLMTPPKKPAKRALESSEPVPTPDEIAQRAYEIFLARGEEHGRDVNDWLQAESELLSERAARRIRRN